MHISQNRTRSILALTTFFSQGWIWTLMLYTIKTFHSAITDGEHTIIPLHPPQLHSGYCKHVEILITGLKWQVCAIQMWLRNLFGIFELVLNTRHPKQQKPCITPSTNISNGPLPWRFFVCLSHILYKPFYWGLECNRTVRNTLWC